MSSQDFSDLTPPRNLVEEWLEQSRSDDCVGAYDDVRFATIAYRAGAEQAAKQLEDQWPKPITDRVPTKEDADEAGYVQFHTPNGRWDYGNWESAARGGYPWRHTPLWRPPAPPTLKEQAIAALDIHVITGKPLDTHLIRRALEADS
jgi:hypothetical protein